MRIIALLTDFGLADHFVGTMKGVILKFNPRVSIVDISHEVKAQDVFEGALKLFAAYKYFPKDSIFVAVVDPGVGTERHPIIIRTKNYFFIGPDNGILSLAAKEDGIKKIVKIEKKIYFLKDVSNTFHGRDIFAPVAAHLSKAKSLSRFGKILKGIKELLIPEPRLSTNTNILEADIIHVDRFGNLISNVDRKTLQKFVQGKKYRIQIQDNFLNGISSSYEEVSEGNLLAIFGSLDLLEISLSRSNASEKLGLKKGAKFRILRQFKLDFTD